MDDDEEIQSHASAATGSPSPSPPNGRITVTVAAVPPSSQQMPPQQQQNNNNALALVPIHQTKSNGGGREDCWSEAATSVLIDAWGERYLELSRGNLKQKHWKEVADIVSSREDYSKAAKTDIQCKNRIDTVKKKYKLEKAKMAAGGGPSKWPFFQRLDHLIGPTAKIPVTAAAAASSVATKVPVGIPVGIRGGSSSNSYQFHQGKSQSKSNQVMKNQNSKPNSRKRGQVETESSSEDEDNFLESEEDDDIPPPEKKPRIVVQRGVNSTKPVKEKKNWGNSIRMLTQAILKFGEAYEQAESAKLQQVVEMEKTRMKFAKELELQRMQFFMKTQMEISQLKRVRRGGNGSSNNHHHHHHSGNNISIPKNNNSDSDN
ncbi:trihelix transcription factor ASIL2-like [Euphorbia lathyris]|uniref:trihelix transcription factor ASIL2-like n=1 Tax=Euphorbia lathyris TaxID=212925 RepID=UPI003313A832